MVFANSTPEKLFRPRAVLIVWLISAFVYAIYATCRFSGDKLLNQYYYVAPIAAALTIFLLDRVRDFRQAAVLQLIIDALVVLTAMWRVIGDVPHVSGHALFLSYSILTINNKTAKILAGTVFLEAIYLKFFVWHDRASAINGIILGTISALIYLKIRASSGTRK